MKLVGIISTAVLSLTLGAAAPAYAQQEEHASRTNAQQMKKGAAGQACPARRKARAARGEKGSSRTSPRSKKRNTHSRKSKNNLRTGEAQSATAAQHEQETQHWHDVATTAAFLTTVSTPILVASTCSSLIVP